MLHKAQGLLFINCLIFPVCKINILDIQACYCGGFASYWGTDSFGKLPCVATAFVVKEQIEKVYAWTGSTICIGLNFSAEGVYLQWYVDDNKNVKFKFVGFYPNMSIPLVY